jgi:Spy/CpxP family protein refolding chaperone
MTFDMGGKKVRFMAWRRDSNLRRLPGWVALAAIAALVGSTGCYHSSTGPQSSGNGPTSSDIPSFAEIQSAVDLTSTQSTALAPAYDSWARSERAWMNDAGQLGEPPVLGFIAASTPVLDRGQVVKLVDTLQRFEVGRVPPQGLDDGLFGGGMGGGMGHGHPGPGHGMPPGHGGHGGDPFGDLGLTPEQRAQLQQAHHTLVATIDSLVHEFRSGNLTAEQFEAAVEQAQAAFETAIQGILTADQYALLQQHRRDRMITMLTARLAAFDQEVTHRVGALDRILDLSDTQVADIRTILANTRTPIENVLAGLRDGSLTPQAAQATLKQIQRDTATAIRATLTPEQAAIFDRLAMLRRLFPGCRP